MNATTMTRNEACYLAYEPPPDGTEVSPYSRGPSHEDRAQVMIKYVEADTQTESGLIIPDTAQQKTGEAIIVDLGLGAWDDSVYDFRPFVNLVVGDRIVVGKYVGTVVKVQRQVAEGINEDGEPTYSKQDDVFSAIKVGDIMAKYEEV